MANSKKRAVVVCPGRGSYNKEELGYLAKYHANKRDFVAGIDNYREQYNRVKIADLDAAKAYALKAHTQSDNASSLIYACAYADFLDINRDVYDIVCITGNSMGWYIALAAAGALAPPQSLDLIETMGQFMANQAMGAQLVYPVVDEHWQVQPRRIVQLQALMAEINREMPNSLYVSINLGGYWVFAGTDKSIAMLQQKLPVIDDRYPMKLFNHAAYHSPLMDSISQHALEALSANMFSKPQVPMIDGTGAIWQPYSTDVEKLHHYTLSTQVVQTYDFSQAITVAVKEFAPDNIILLGPGSSLGGSVAQSLIASGLHGLTQKLDFIEQQKAQPFLLSMGLESQRDLVVNG